MGKGKDTVDGWTVAKHGSKGWTLTDPDGDHVQIGDHGGVAPTKTDAIAERAKRISADRAAEEAFRLLRGGQLPVHDMVTRRSFSLLPVDHVDRGVFEVAVEYRGEGRWAVMWLGKCLSTSGDWTFEPIPSSRDDVFLAAHRFGRAEAERLAMMACRTLKMNGHHVETIARRAAGG